MSIDLNKKYYFNGSFEKRTIMNKITFTDFDKAQWVRVNDMGDMIVSQLDGSVTLKEIMSNISLKFGISESVINELCADFLEKISDLGLIYSEEDATKMCECGIAQENDADQLEEETYPRSIWIHITGRCNLNCPFCYSKSGSNNTNILDREDIYRYLSQIPVESRQEVVLSGGEPFTYPELEELVRGLKEQMEFKTIRIISNGTIGHAVYDKIAPYISSIQFSVDGPVAEINDLSRGAGSFEKTLKGIRTARKAGIKNLMISITQTVDNYRYLRDMPQFLKDNEVYRLHITRLMPVGRGRQSAETLGITQNMFIHELDAFYEEYLRVAREIAMDREIYDVGLPMEEKRPNLFVTFAGDLVERVNLRGRKVNCGLGKNIISINYDGKLYACPSLHMEPYCLGDINGNIKEALLRGATLNEALSVDNPDSDCNKCKYKYFCGGNCAARKLAMNGIGVEDLECDTIRDTIDKHIATLDMEN